MCLFVDEKIHTPERKRATYRIASQDILVYKVLKNPHEKCGYAPYMDTRWTFGSPRSYQRLRKSLNITNEAIEAGLHAFTSLSTAEYRASKLDTSGFYGSYNKYKVFPAVIPKGSRLYFGCKDDIVATDLIVYKDRVSLVAARGPIGKGIKKKLISNSY